MRRINEAGKQECRDAEGLAGGRPALRAYLDSAAVPTIGFGHTKGVKMGDRCTPQQAEQWLDEDLADAERAVYRLVKVPLNDNQFAALVLFVFNVGVGAFSGSTLLRVLNAGRYDQVPTQMLRWNKAYNPKTRRKEPLRGLTNRRNIEIALWLRPASLYDSELDVSPGRPATPPAPRSVLQTSTGKAQTTALVAGGTAAAVEVAGESFGSTLQEVVSHLTGLAWVFEGAKYALVAITLLMIGWTLWDRRKKLKEQGH